MRLNLVGLVAGIAFGGLLAGAELHEYDTIHAMLRLDEPHVFLIMASAIGLATPGLWWMERRQMRTALGGRVALSRSMPESHHIKGGAIFGLGWAVAGTCPAPALVMISSGAALGAVAMGGIFLGMFLRERQVKGAMATGDGEGRDLVEADAHR